MIDKDDSQGQKGAAAHKALSPTPNQSVSQGIGTSNEGIERTTATTPRDNELETAEDAFKRFEKWQLIINGAAVIVGAVVCVIYGLQLHVMSGQLDEMKGSSAQADKLIAQAIVQANAAKAQSDAMKAQAESTKAVAQSGLDQAKATNKLATESGRSADAAVANSKAAQDTAVTGQRSLTLSERIMFVQERPWVGIQAFNASVESGKPVTGSISFNNFGHSPAFDAGIVTACTFDRPPSLSLEFSYFFVNSGSKSIMMPGGGKSTDGLSCDLHLSAMQFNLVEQGLKTIYLFGIIRYRDSINTANPSHTTRFCGHWNPKTKIFDDCPSYNSAD